MKTIETIKQEFKNSTGRDLPIYTFEGKLGVLMESEHGLSDFIPMDDLINMESIDFDAVRWVNEGAEGCNEGEEITEGAIVCPGNEQKLMHYIWTPVTYQKSDEYVRELLVTTTKYYDWTSDRSRMIDALQQDLNKYAERFADAECEDDSEVMESLRNNFKSYLAERRKDWEKTCAQYEDPEGWEEFNQNKADFSSVLEESLDGYDYDGTHEAIDVATDYLTEIKDE